MAERYDDLRKSRSKRPKYKEVTIPHLVATGYTAFVAAQKKLEKKEEAKKESYTGHSRQKAGKETLKLAGIYAVRLLL